MQSDGSRKHQASARRRSVVLLRKDDPAEVRVDGHEDATLRSRPSKNDRVARIGPVIPALADIVALASEPLSQATTGAAVDEKLHLPVASTASSESLAITACA